MDRARKMAFPFVWVWVKWQLRGPQWWKPFIGAAAVAAVAFTCGVGLHFLVEWLW